jgi:hemerythrin
MAVFNWKEDYSVSVPSIDSQHKKLIGYINQLYNSMRVGDGSKAIAEVLEGLTSYTLNHFNAEEQLMIQFKYYNYPSHKKQHEDLIKKVDEFKKQFTPENHKIIFELAEFLKKWLINHIAVTDKILGNYLQAKGVI